MDPDPFYDEIIEKKIFENIKKAGVTIKNNYTLKDIIPDENGNCETIVLEKPYDEA